MNVRGMVSVGGLLRYNKWMRPMECDQAEEAHSMGMSICDKIEEERTNK